jgi:nitrate/nitrite transport system substrate-binding protein
MVKQPPDYSGVAKRVMRSDIYLDALKELGAAVKIAEQQTITLFDGTFDGSEPDKYAASFKVHSMA